MLTFVEFPGDLTQDHHNMTSKLISGIQAPRTGDDIYVHKYFFCLKRRCSINEMSSHRSFIGLNTVNDDSPLTRFTLFFRGFKVISWGLRSKESTIIESTSKQRYSSTFSWVNNEFWDKQTAFCCNFPLRYWISTSYSWRQRLHLSNRPAKYFFVLNQHKDLWSVTMLNFQPQIKGLNFLQAPNQR